MKKFIAAIILLAIVSAVIVVIKRVNFGTLLIGVLERAAQVEIEYKSIQGTIFRGYEIRSYCIKLSETDSIYGELGQINYRFSLLKLGLPRVFEIYLIEPTAHLRKKTTSAKPGIFQYPRLHLSLRINIKNGKIIYRGGETGKEEIYPIEDIAGLIFIDFVGPKIYLSTMNLSFKNPNYQITVTSLNLSSMISNQGIAIKPLNAKGNGFVLSAEVHYLSLEDRWSFKLANVELDLERIGIYKGRLNFLGEIEYSRNIFKPHIMGTGQGLEPFDRFKFETGSLADTTLLNVVDGELLDGSFFAQIKFINFNNWTLETNFKNLNLAKLINSGQAVLISGHLGYQKERFSGFVTSPIEHGLGIDSLLFFGFAKNSMVYLDSLFIREGKKSLSAQGAIATRCSLNIIFKNFDLARFRRYLPLQGRLSGQSAIEGDLKNWQAMSISTNISGSNLTFADFSVKEFVLKTRNFSLRKPIEYLRFAADSVFYQRNFLDSILVSVEGGNFLLKLGRADDSLHLTGFLDKDGKGSVSALFIEYNGVKTKSLAPISFDIVNKKIGEFSLSFIDGTLKGTLSPMAVSLNSGNLEKLGKMLRLSAEIDGSFDLSFQDNQLTLSAQNVDYSSMNNGVIKVRGKVKSKQLFIDSLILADDNQQELYASGILSPNESKINLRFKNLKPWVLPFLTAFLQKPDGLMAGEIDFQGNFEDFKIFGQGEISQGTFGIAPIKTRLDSVSCRVKFAGDRIIFDDGTGKVYSDSDIKLPGTGHATGGGIIKLEPRLQVKNLNFEFSFKDAPIQYEGYAYGIGSGNLSLSYKDRITSYNGNIAVREGIIPAGFGLKPAEGARRPPDNWRMNLKISGERNVWLRNSQADIEFGGELYLIKEEGPLYLAGNFIARRGNFYWLNHILKITEGKAIFVPEERVDPQIDFWAELNTGERAPTGEEIKIKLHCFGTISEPIFEFFTDPEGLYTEQDIITYLNLNITWNELEAMSRGEYVGKVLPRSLWAWLESDVSRRLRAYTGLDYFRIEAPLFEPEEKTKLTAGKYLSRDLFITYTYDITSFANEFNVEYFIDDRNEILIRKDEKGEYGLQYLYRIRF